MVKCTFDQDRSRATAGPDPGETFELRAAPIDGRGGWSLIDIAPTSPDPVEAFIGKGGSVPTPVPEEREAKAPQHPLKFPADSDLFERLERARSASVVKLPRNTWILQAIAEKLKRDS